MKLALTKCGLEESLKNVLSELNRKECEDYFSGGVITYLRSVHKDVVPDEHGAFDIGFDNDTEYRITIERRK